MNTGAAPTTPAAGSSPPAKQAAAWLAPLLAGVAGFVDTAGFIVFAGVFLAHVTGNFVVLGATLSGQEHGSAAQKLAVLPLFVVGVAMGWLIVRAAPPKGARRMAVFEGLLLLVSGGLGAWGHLSTPMPHAAELIAIACGVVAMGLQSMLARLLKLPMTHVMTGNVTQLTVDLLDARFGRPECLPSARRSIVLVAAFASGAIVAGLLVPTVGLACLVIPAAALFGASSLIE